MCRRVDCPKCGRPTFAGCGAHVEQVLGDVSPSDRCRCRAAASADTERAPGTGGGSWLRDVLGKLSTFGQNER